MRLSDRGVLVTGASRGIGRAVAEAFAANGDRVVVHHRQAQALADEVAESLPGRGHTVLQADLADPRAIPRLVEHAVQELGTIDVLVNNAGVYPRHPLDEVDYEQWQDAWQRTLGVNLIGVANLTYCVVRHMMSRGGGRIVNVSSRGAFRGEPEHPAYGASKAGLNAFAQSLAQAVGSHGIAVATVAPGWVETDMTRADLDSPLGDRVRAQSPFARVARPDEVAAAVLYLASPQAEFASGAILDLNGASYLRT
jgi:NAD(P)-dependent dehydrogenase (short-subunit alcohol dehydrogenase family)